MQIKVNDTLEGEEDDRQKILLGIMKKTTPLSFSEKKATAVHLREFLAEPCWKECNAGTAEPINFFENPAMALETIASTNCVCQEISDAIDKISIRYQMTKNGIFIKDEILLGKLKDINDIKSIDKTIVDYHFGNNAEKIKFMIGKWKKSGINPKRIVILEDALNLVVTCPYVSSYNAVIPTLLAQLTGLKEDLWNLAPEVTKKEIKTQVKSRFLVQYPNFEPNAGTKKHYEQELLKHYGEDPIHTMILYNCFKNMKEGNLSDSIAINKEFNLYRHKILHGDENFLDYGNPLNLIRGILYIDFIIDVIVKINGDRKKIVS